MVWTAERLPTISALVGRISFDKTVKGKWGEQNLRSREHTANQAVRARTSYFSNCCRRRPCTTTDDHAMKPGTTGQPTTAVHTHKNKNKYPYTSHLTAYGFDIRIAETPYQQQYLPDALRVPSGSVAAGTGMSVRAATEHSGHDLWGGRSKRVWEWVDGRDSLQNS